VNATVSFNVPAGGGVFCYAASGNAGNFNDGYIGGLTSVQNQGQVGQAAVVDDWLVEAGDVVNLYCFAISSTGLYEIGGSSITATLINVDNGIATGASVSPQSLPTNNKRRFQNWQTIPRL
jgi:hypothetical protein